MQRSMPVPEPRAGQQSAPPARRPLPAQGADDAERTQPGGVIKR
jgi:hypothetical protein